MDHVIHGPSMISFRPAPTLPTEELVKDLADGIKGCIGDKLVELCDVMDELEINRKKNHETLQSMANSLPLDYFSLYFWALFIENEFAEYLAAQQWLRYWLRLLEMATEERLLIRTQFEVKGVSEMMIEQAKQFPIDQLYVGPLRKLGTRSIGNCPFHEEKTGSFTIFGADNHFYCFGCQAWGDPIDFLMKRDNVTFMDAVKELQ